MGATGLVATVVSAGLLAWPAPVVSPSTGAPAAAVVPCPYTTIATIPPTPASPVLDPTVPAVGGGQLGTTGLALAAGAAAPPTLSAMSWVVADLDTGEVLGACAPHLRRRPASVQKLLLAATALAKLDPALVVEATAEDLALPKDSSAVGMIVGGKYPVSTLWLGLLLQSGNDTANALARLAGGDGGVAATVAAMNAEAHRLGADDTHAVTPSGLDAPDQLTSAYDLALIARADFVRPDFVTYDTTLVFQWPAQPPKDPKGFQIQNENKLLTSYEGALGGKTGFTDEARHTYVGAARRNGRRLVVTVMGAEIVPARAWKQGAMLLDWGFAQPAGTSVGRLVTPEEAAALHSRPPTTPPPSVTPVAQPAGGYSIWPTVLAIGAVALTAVAVTVVTLIRRRRRA